MLSDIYLKLKELKKLSDPATFVKENVEEAFNYPYSYINEYKNQFFENLWENEYNDIIINLLYYCGSHWRDYLFDMFDNIFSELTLEYYYDWFVNKSSKKIKEYFSNHKEEILSPQYEKYQKSWKTVFSELPPTFNEINKRYTWDLNDFLNAKVDKVILDKKIIIVSRDRISKISGEIFNDAVYTDTFHRVKHRGFPEWDLQNYIIEIGGLEFDLFKKHGSKKEIIDSIIYLRELLDFLGFIPDPNANLYYIYKNIQKDKFIDFINIQKNVYCFYDYMYIYGDWYKAIIETGYLGNYGIKKNIFGYSVVAKDGDLCNSLAEKVIDDWFFKNNIKHKKEPLYPKCVKDMLNSNVKADWLIDDLYIEYFGLQSNKDYAEKTKLKIYACNKNNIKLKALYPGDEYCLDEIFSQYIKKAK